MRTPIWCIVVLNSNLYYILVQSSEMAFDILACGACILFPR